MTTPRIRTRDVITAAEKVLGVSAADLTGRRRSVSLSRDRQLAILVAAQVTDQPLKQIARVFNRDHTRCRHAVKCARRRLDESPALMATVARIAAGAAVAAVEWQAKWRAEAERIEERRNRPMVRPRRWAEIDDRRLRSLWETALSIEAIGFEMDRNPRTVRDNALKLGLPPREPRHPKAMLNRVARRAADAHRP